MSCGLTWSDLVWESSSHLPTHNELCESQTVECRHLRIIIYNSMALKMHPTVNASRGLPGTCSLRVAQNARVPILGAEASQGSQRFTFRCGQKVQMSCLFSQLFPATRRPVFIMEFGVWSMECGVWSVEYGVWSVEYA